jgi:hypothetical protein
MKAFSFGIFQSQFPGPVGGRLQLIGNGKLARIKGRRPPVAGQMR